MRKLSADVISKLDRKEVRVGLARLDKNQIDLARHLRVTPQHLSDMLHGKRNAARYVKRIAAFLGVAGRTILLADEVAGGVVELDGAGRAALQ